ncbi:M56 family metallopeptidase [uncultured Ezakiella sp.]|uniref:M56 family metallopeptidase n=1 Tax=uncultured Ezakiella sp. TaxID=1637529 RepID=UPI00345AD87A
MILSIIKSNGMQRSLKAIFLLTLILLIRKKLNLNSIKRATKILWTIMIVYLIIPFTLMIRVPETIKDNIFIKALINFDQMLWAINNSFSEYLWKYYRVIIGIIILIYLIKQIIKLDKLMKDSVLLAGDKRIEDYIKSFNIKRKVRVYLNDKAKVPATYGLFKPKIILQEKILNDDDLLKHTIYHEMTHIKKYDIVFSYIKNIAICLHWYNPFIWISSKYIQNDIEILCDKLVVNKLGDNRENRKEYCLSMGKLLGLGTTEFNQSIEFRPNMERMVIMKNWNEKIIGLLAFILAIFLSLAICTEVVADEEANIIIEKAGAEFANDSIVSIISDEDYEKLNLQEFNQTGLRSANVDESESIEGYGYKTYSFDMSTWRGANHDGLVIKISDVYPAKGADYTVILKETGKTIYREIFSDSVNIKVETRPNLSYELLIQNSSSHKLKYKIQIKSYKR